MSDLAKGPRRLAESRAIDLKCNALDLCARGTSGWPMRRRMWTRFHFTSIACSDALSASEVTNLQMSCEPEDRVSGAFEAIA